MKKLLVLIILIAGGYFTYQYLLKDKTVLEIKADKSITTEQSMDINAPALSPAGRNPAAAASVGQPRVPLSLRAPPAPPPSVAYALRELQHLGPADGLSARHA